MSLPPPIAATRSAIRAALAALPHDQPVLIACSGGADSVALAAGAAFVCTRQGRPAGLISVDHRLQAGSARRAAAVAALGTQLGLAPSRAVAVDVGPATGGGGPEAAARDARHRALDDAAAAMFATPAAVLLGHTLDDQAETVLLGLGRGAGGRSLAGMRPDRPAGPDGAARRLRPFLGLRRADTRAACALQGLAVWDDPHNDDPRFRRVRVRREALPLLEDVLGGGVAGALARTAAHLQEDGDALDALAGALLAAHAADDGSLLLNAPAEPPPGQRASAALGDQPRALRIRVLRAWLRAAGQPALARPHLDDLDRLIVGWRGQRHVCLPGGGEVTRRSGRLHLQSPSS